MPPVQTGQIITLDIHALGSSGEGVGYHDGYTLFVEGALPGELVEARITTCQARFGRGDLVRVLRPSPNRVEPVCPLFGACGGCQVMHLSYPEQLNMKRQRVVDALGRIGKLTPEVSPCEPSPSPLHYRNKIQLPVKIGKNGLGVGLFARGSHDLIEVKSCFIHCPLGEKVYKEIRDLISEELQHILIKTAVHSAEVLVILVTAGKITPNLRQTAKTIMQRCPEVKGVVHNCQPKEGNAILGREFQVIDGKGHITETLCDLIFKVSPASFFQVNPAQAERLYQFALECADLTGEETILDAYCGVGTLSLIFAKRGKKVIGVECVPEAIRDAKENALLNQISNTAFTCAPAETFIASLSKIDVALLNPPRKGCDPAFLAGIKRLSPKRVIYISCDPGTLARDLAELHKMGYAIERVQPFDMFPQTAHVECVVSLAN